MSSDKVTIIVFHGFARCCRFSIRVVCCFSKSHFQLLSASLPEPFDSQPLPVRSASVKTSQEKIVPSMLSGRRVDPKRCVIPQCGIAAIDLFFFLYRCHAVQRRLTRFSSVSSARCHFNLVCWTHRPYHKSRRRRRFRIDTV